MSRVRFQGFTAGAALFRAASATVPGVVYDAAIDLETRAVACTCPHGVHRMNGKGVLASEHSRLCWHVRRAARNLRRRMRQGGKK